MAPSKRESAAALLVDSELDFRLNEYNKTQYEDGVLRWDESNTYCNELASSEDKIRTQSLRSAAFRK